MELHATFPAKIEHLREMLSWISSHLKDCDRKILLKVELACEEAIVNIILHAYKHRPGQIEIELKCEKKELTMIFTDRGPFFNPLETPKADLDQSLEEREIGGLGIHLMRKCMDKIEYKREGEKNILVLKKLILKRKSS